MARARYHGSTRTGLTCASWATRRSAGSAYTGDGLPEIVASDPEGSWFFSGPPTETLYRADADLFLPGVNINGPELDLDLDGNLEFAGWQIVSLEGPAPVVDTLLDDVGYYNMHFVDFDSDGLPEIFGPTSNAALIHVEAPITLQTIQAAEQLPTANPAFLAGDIQGVSAIGRDWWAYSEVRPYSPERLEHEGCDSPRIAYALSGGDLTDASVEARRSYFDTYQRDRPSPRASRAGDFNGDGVADLLIDDVGDTLILLGPIEPGLIRLEHAIRIPKQNGIGLSTHQRDAIFDIDGDGRDDIIATYSPGTPWELHIYLASSFLAGPFEFPTTP